jgi:hypothetical protein
MRVLIDLLRQRGPEVVEPDDFARFHVEVLADSPDWAKLDGALKATSAGQLQGEHVLVSLDWLGREAQRPTPDWQDGFAAMIAYATKQGWADDTARTVRAHVAWVTDRSDVGPPTPRARA